MKSKILFIIPDPDDFPSGGNIYNQDLIKGLQSIAVETEVIFTPSPTTSIVEDVCFVDTLFANRITKGTFVEPTFLIVHHLASMELTGPAKEKKIIQEKTLLDQFHGCLSTSTFTTKYLRSRMGWDKPILTVPPALSDSQIIPAVPSKNKLKVLMVANLIERKGILDFLQLWAAYTWPPAFSLEIIGTPDLAPSYAKACFDFYATLPTAQQEQITFAGAKSHREVLEKYRDVQLFVSASRMETFGMAIQEALASGVPVFLLKGGYADQHLMTSQSGEAFESLPSLVEALNRWSMEEKFRARWSIQNQNTLVYSWEEAASDFIRQLKKYYPDV